MRNENRDKQKLGCDYFYEVKKKIFRSIFSSMHGAIAALRAFDFHNP
jgi:hypothetical protein